MTLPFTNSDETEESSESLSDEDVDSSIEEDAERGEEADGVELEAEQDGSKRNFNSDEEDEF